MPVDSARFSASVAVCLVAIVATASTQAPAQPATVPLPPRVERVYSVLSKQFSPERAMQLVTFMAPHWRLPGNPSFEASEHRISQGLAEAGFVMKAQASDAAIENAQGKGGRLVQWYEEYAQSRPAWEPVSAKIALAASSSGVVEQAVLDMSREVDRVSLCINSFSTPAEGMRAPLVVVGRGATASDYEKVDVRGAIVLGEADAGQLFEQAIRQRGAVGVLSTAAARYTRPAETPDIVQWSGIRYDENLHAFGFKISPRLAALLKQRLAAGPVTLQVNISTRFFARPNRTLVAEITGRTRPGERVVLAAHVQEPGANDNASGCATLAELARNLASAIARGQIPPPERTITFLWGDEISASRQWLRAEPSRAASVRYAFSLDMTGEDVTKTGGSFLIEKQPDPSAVWLRPSDPHTEWGSSRVAAESLKGNLLNDLHLAICLRRARDTGWVVKANPYEGGSDHSVFLASGIPALLDWHFTDRYYHTNLDTPDKTSPAEMANVGIAVGSTVWTLASASNDDAIGIAGVIEKAALDRLALEAKQSQEALRQAGDKAESIAAREATVFAAWQRWYVEVLQSVLALATEQPSAALHERIDSATKRIKAQGDAQKGAVRGPKSGGLTSDIGRRTSDLLRRPPWCARPVAAGTSAPRSPSASAGC